MRGRVTRELRKTQRNRAFMAKSKLLSGDYFLPGDEEFTRWEMLGAAGSEPDPYDSAAESDLRDRVREALRFLPARERRVVELRYGLGGDRTGGFRSLEELRPQFGGLTRARLQQIEARAFGRLRKLLAPAAADLAR
jgi:DNA-directed RNA polymerase sigma subunit (sigma70/sigma32)